MSDKPIIDLKRIAILITAYPNEVHTCPLAEEVPALREWAIEAVRLMEAAVEYNRECIAQWHECDLGCECYVCEMKKLLARIEGASDE